MEDEVESLDKRRVICREGVVTTVTTHTFTIVCKPTAEIWEQQVVLLLKEWVRGRATDEE